MTKEEAEQAVEMGYRVTNVAFGDGEYIKKGNAIGTLSTESSETLSAELFWTF